MVEVGQTIQGTDFVLFHFNLSFTSDELFHQPNVQYIFYVPYFLMLIVFHIS